MHSQLESGYSVRGKSLSVFIRFRLFTLVPGFFVVIVNLNYLFNDTNLQTQQTITTWGWC